MIYNPTKIKELMEAVKKHLTIEEQLTVRELVENYNKMYALAREKIIYVKRKQEQYVKESNENDKLREENKELRRRNELYKTENKELHQLIGKLGIDLRRKKEYNLNKNN